MNYRYLIIERTDDFKLTNSLTKDDLIKCKNRWYETIVDLEERKYFDAENNEWVEIETAE